MTEWDPDGPGPLPALLVLAGSFDGQAVVAWDGAGIRQLGTGIPSDNAKGRSQVVQVVAVFDGELIAAGYFTEAGGVHADNIAAFDGVGWRPLGGGTNPGSQVWAMTVFENSLIVGGQLGTAGGVPLGNIGRWDGTSWHRVGNGFNGNGVRALTSYAGELIAGGDFTNSNSARYVARLGPDNLWRTVGAGVNYRVHALAVHDDQLIVAGDFGFAGGVPVQGLARWNGTAWNSMGTGVCGPEAFSVLQGTLYAGGHFEGCGSPPRFRHLARWNGSEWDGIGAALDMGARALATFRGELIIGGGFAYAGELESRGWVRWAPTPSPWIALQTTGPITSCRGGAVQLTASPASEYSDLTFQWERDGEQMHDGPHPAGGFVAGASTGTLTLEGVEDSYAGRYRCTVCNGCGCVVTEPVDLRICGADFDCEGGVNSSDFFAFVTAFFAGAADFNGSGTTDSQDFFDFLAAFFAGC